MKKILPILLIFAVLAASCMIFAGCTDKKSDGLDGMWEVISYSSVTYEGPLEDREYVYCLGDTVSFDFSVKFDEKVAINAKKAEMVFEVNGAFHNYNVAVSNSDSGGYLISYADSAVKEKSQYISVTLYKDNIIRINDINANGSTYARNIILRKINGEEAFSLNTELLDGTYTSSTISELKIDGENWSVKSSTAILAGTGTGRETVKINNFNYYKVVDVTETQIFVAYYRKYDSSPKMLDSTLYVLNRQ